MTVYAKGSTGRQKMTPKSSLFPLVGGVATGRPSPVMPLTWREGKAAALDAVGVSARLRFAAGNSLDDLPMLGRSRGAGLLCVPGAGAGVGVAEGPRQLAAAAEAEGYWLHEATAGPKDWRRLAWETAQAEAT